MMYPLLFIFGVIFGYVFHYWWIKPDLQHLRDRVDHYERLREARLRRGIEVLHGAKAAKEAKIDGVNG